MKNVISTTVCLLLFVNLYGQEIDFNVFPSEFDDSAERYEQLKTVLGRMPTPPPLDLDTLEIKNIEGGQRLLIEYTAELADTIFNTPIDRVKAYLFVPTLKKEKLPAIVAIHHDGSKTHLGKLETAGFAGDVDMH